jgi:hypothetical protein
VRLVKASVALAILGAAILAVSAHRLEAQTAGPLPRLEVFAGVGSTGFSRYEDQGFGRHGDVSVGAAIRLHRAFAIQVERAWVSGLKSDSPGCTREGGPCRATSESISGLLIGTGRIQPYLMGGMVLLRSDTAYKRDDRGAGPLVGIGVKVAITRNVYVQSSLWAGMAVWLSYSNFSTSRASIAAGYRW